MKKRIRDIFIFTIISCIAISIYGWKEFVLQTPTINVDSVNVYKSIPIHPDHIIFLWLENKGFNTIIGSDSAHFINSLIKKGTLFTNTYAITHPSYPNYVNFFAGAPNGVTNDACINNSTLATPNLYTILKDVGKSFAWYSEDLPTTGSKICISKNYVAKHNPTTIFTNVPDTVNKRFADLPADYNQLENVVCISPNLVDDMHNGTIKQADTWLKKHLGKLVNWCTTHNSVFVIYFDESESNNDNRIPVIAIGQHVKTGFKLNARYDHFSWTKTISAMFLAQDGWTDNLSTAKLITGCWK